MPSGRWQGGKNVIVVDDPKQMPLTNFFSKGASEEDLASDYADLESILDEAMAARVPHHRLTGHYRSRYESLIAFSNHAYYDNRLITYPSVEAR
jgi:superfamily I DNA and/or RNA helicase